MNSKDTSTCIIQLLYCTPETNTTLLINYTPISNKNFKNKKIKINKMNEEKGTDSRLRGLKKNEMLTPNLVISLGYYEVRMKCFLQKWFFFSVIKSYMQFTSL